MKFRSGFYLLLCCMGESGGPVLSPSLLFLSFDRNTPGTPWVLAQHFSSRERANCANG